MKIVIRYKKYFKIFCRLFITSLAVMNIAFVVLRKNQFQNMQVIVAVNMALISSLIVPFKPIQFKLIFLWSIIHCILTYVTINEYSAGHLGKVSKGSSGSPFLEDLDATPFVKNLLSVVFLASIWASVIVSNKVVQVLRSKLSLRKIRDLNDLNETNFENEVDQTLDETCYCIEIEDEMAWKVFVKKVIEKLKESYLKKPQQFYITNV